MTFKTVGKKKPGQERGEPKQKNDNPGRIMGILKKLAENAGSFETTKVPAKHGRFTELNKLQKEREAILEQLDTTTNPVKKSELKYRLRGIDFELRDIVESFSDGVVVGCTDVKNRITTSYEFQKLAKEREELSKEMDATTDPVKREKLKEEISSIDFALESYYY